MKSLEDRFFEKVSVHSDGCHLWTGKKNGSGYGLFYRDGRFRFAHRVAVALSTGQEPGQYFVLHSCDNPPCVNPSHLSLGTHAENMADMKAKGRARGSYKFNPLCGEMHHKAKLTAMQVRAIRGEYEAFSYPGPIPGRVGSKYGALTVIGEKYGVGKEQVRRIVTGQRWSTA